MGEIANYKINGVDIYGLKNEFSSSPILMEAFAPNDWVTEDESEEDAGYLGFKTTREIAVERLDAQGFTLRRSIDALRAAAHELRDYMASPKDDPDEEDTEWLYLDDYGSRIEWDEIFPVLEDDEATVSGYAQVLKSHLDTEKTWFPSIVEHGTVIAPVNALAKRLLSCEAHSVLWASPFFPEDIAPEFILRICLESAPGGSTVEYDCTHPLRYWDESLEDQLWAYLNRTTFSPAAQTIVLTEGETDDRFLGYGFELLRPNVKHLFRFFDCHNGAEPERSAAALQKLCASMASAGLQEKFLFLFDNDAVGNSSLQKTPADMPENMKAMPLPELEVANDYPTFGPNGLARANVNGRAVSIEFFLGVDSLKNGDGELRPIVWNEFHSGTYQGSFAKDDKKEIQQSFEQAVQDAREHGIASSKHDWGPMEYLLDTLIESASKLNGPAINYQRLF